MPAAARTLERLCLFLLATSVGCSRAFFSQLQLRSDSSSYSSLCAQFGYNIASTAFIATRAIQTAASHPIAGSSGSCSPASGLQRSFCETSTASAGSTTTMAEAGFSSRSIDQVVISNAQAEGAGALVYRSIGGMRLRNFDPFLLLDEFDVDPSAGFPDHPHRGFETVTYMLRGIMEHEDFCGHRGKIGPGSLQWMTAGKGIVHAEMPTGHERGHGLQLWVNLKAKDKMIQPAYQELEKDDIPHVTKDGVTAIVIAGEALGVSSPVQTRTPTHYIHFKMEPGCELKQPIPEAMNAFLYVLAGNLVVGEASGAAARVGPHNTVTLTKEGSGIMVKTFNSPADFVLICGEPTNEPVVQRGPFVMNTQEEIQQAMLDYNTGSNGFENASRWYSEIGLPLTHANRRR